MILCSSLLRDQNSKIMWFDLLTTGSNRFLEFEIQSMFHLQLSNLKSVLIGRCELVLNLASHLLKWWGMDVQFYTGGNDPVKVEDQLARLSYQEYANLIPSIILILAIWISENGCQIPILVIVVWNNHFQHWELVQPWVRQNYRNCPNITNKNIFLMWQFCCWFFRAKNFKYIGDEKL